jgi:hypothetical protein
MRCLFPDDERRRHPSSAGRGADGRCAADREWQRAGVSERLLALLLTELRAAGEIEWSRAVADSSHVPAKKGFATGPAG